MMWVYVSEYFRDYRLGVWPADKHLSAGVYRLADGETEQSRSFHDANFLRHGHLRLGRLFLVPEPEL